MTNIITSRHLEMISEIPHIKNLSDSKIIFFLTSLKTQNWNINLRQVKIHRTVEIIEKNGSYCQKNHCNLELIEKIFILEIKPLAKQKSLKIFCFHIFYRILRNFCMCMYYINWKKTPQSDVLIKGVNTVNLIQFLPNALEYELLNQYSYRKQIKQIPLVFTPQF